MNLTTTAREIAAALVLFGAAGTAAMTVYQLALKSVGASLPAALAGRVHWWRGHLTVVRVISACVLALGLLGLIVL